MQQRILNYRPSWTLIVTDNVTSNYYPISSAIALRNGSNQLTVMNSRPQGGSVLKPGRIELMHNRRMYYDDHRGMGEPLNETDATGNGITTISNYYVQIFDMSREESEQRVMQLHQDEPLQYFFNFLQNSSTAGATPNGHLKRLPNTKELRALNFPRTSKIETFPMGHNSILLRLENIADKFDLAPNYTVPYIRVDTLASFLYNLSNPEATA